MGQTQKKSRRELEQQKKAAERALVQREAELMDPNLRPQDDSAFERLILASPNSSLLWLQYMAHHLQATQIEQARSVAERALKTISFRYAHVKILKLKKPDKKVFLCEDFLKENLFISMSLLLELRVQKV